MFEFNDSDSDSSVATEPKEPALHRPDPTTYRASEPSAVARRGRLAMNATPKAIHPIYFPVKYFCERVLALGALVIVAPVILILVILVRATSKGPGIYRQERVGLGRKSFDVFKLRTMYQDAEADGRAKWSQKGDPRITPLGRFLRRTHLDELPQLWNVVIGDMSLTGPRPERPSICEKLKQHIPNYYARTEVKPGITGLAQINLEPDCTIDDVRRKQCLDLHYIHHANLWLDLRMLFATVLRMIGIRGSVVTRWMGLCRKHVIEAQGLQVVKMHSRREPDAIEVDLAVSGSRSSEPCCADKRLRVDRAPRPK
ncbi:UDP-N-acetylgalactosamine-undecaprenyl-phosphate N-acetylgalactosaminephosphotransferase [Stieleria maiorica]|uniref:UDP-N-acetylgalactosamine-undecaprenyl-phosphate N-acetylgalactosaminephosphotransferase n=1 Tax=Stieleria maiorica TaxID=2795974 RepID=A0A5B9MHY6_9BACT|nr:UDP-N-acetylgalactosamine-undecaprenyl-phosphate N-acetylgalactosaminephosphotransferase [Stieleria maiorica]